MIQTRDMGIDVMKNQIAPVRPVGFPGRASSALTKIQKHQSLLAMTSIISSTAS
jgi:hypothetical protein